MASGALLIACLLGGQAAAVYGAETSPDAPGSGERTVGAAPRRAPEPLPEHPGNVFVEGEPVQARAPEPLRAGATQWRLLDDQHHEAGRGVLNPAGSVRAAPIELGVLGVGWYRLEFGSTNQPCQAWTTLAVLRRLRAPVPADSPVAVDTAAAWFARDDAAQQKRLANLAALAGVSWIRDRLRWRDLQPQAGPLRDVLTTYDTSAEAHREAGLQVLQVFHDTPSWAAERSGGSGRFAPDLRHVYELGRALAVRFKGRVAAWEPWNEANVATFGAHTVDQMCSWQKAAWLGFKAGDPAARVCWNPTAAVPTPAQTEGVLANETEAYFDTYNIHTYDWAHGYAELWKPARAAAAGRPLWITEADRGTPHLKNPPWYDQDPRLERLKAEYMAQSFASSLFAGAERHFHFVLGNYQEPNGVQFGLLRLDLTPRPAYVALAAVGRCLAGARVLGRWRPAADISVYAFRARPDGVERDVLVAWAEKEADWDGRGRATARWTLPSNLTPLDVFDYLGRSRGRVFPPVLTSAPLFVFLPAGQAQSLPLEAPPAPAPPRERKPSPVVLQAVSPRSAIRPVKDLPWSEAHVYRAGPGQPLELSLNIYNFATNAAAGRVRVLAQPSGWEATLAETRFTLRPLDRFETTGVLRITGANHARDGWVVLKADCGPHGQPALAFRVVTPP